MIPNEIIFKKLNYRRCNQKEMYKLFSSINSFFCIKNKKIDFYNPNLNFFTNFVEDSYTFNFHEKLQYIVEKKQHVGSYGSFYKVVLKNKKQKKFFKTIFIKELPMFSFEDYSGNIQKKSIFKKINDKNYRINNKIYDINSKLNVEIFVSYLISKLSELNISPSFCKLHGCLNTVLYKYTERIHDGDDINEIKYNCKKHPNKMKIRKSYHRKFIVIKNMPTYLIAYEKADIDLLEYINTNKISEEFLKSISFQLFSAIVVMYRRFGIKHNDLHFSNVMLKKTKLEYLYYKFGENYFKIPTHGFIVKIIDWGRAIYNFNEFNITNSIFNNDEDCFGQYVKKKINNIGIKDIDGKYNPWSDIIMISYSFLHELEKFRETKLGLFFKNILKKNEDKKIKVDIDSFNWNIYKQITNIKYRITPKYIFKNSIYNNFKLVSKEKPKEYIYYI